jgi:hypothetical protein
MNARLPPARRRMMTRWKRRAVQTVFDRYMRWRLPDLLRPEYPVILKYPVRPEPRYGDGKPPHADLAAFFAQHDAAYLDTLRALAAGTGPLMKVEDTRETAAPGDPHWQNIFFSALDAIALYGLLGVRAPARYVEIGSGHSTRFARRAVEDFGLRTEIVSVDPHPRAEIDAICDRVIRQPLEDVDLTVLTGLAAGDMLFLDSSHVTFENSDVTVFFLEVLPRLRTGVIVHIHDIFLPFDYPREWADRHYSEQYLLAAYLLGGANRVRPVLPAAYISRHPQLAPAVDALWPHPHFQRAFAEYRRLTGGYLGTSLWLEIV